MTFQVDFRYDDDSFPPKITAELSRRFAEGRPVNCSSVNLHPDVKDVKDDMEKGSKRVSFDHEFRGGRASVLGWTSSLERRLDDSSLDDRKEPESVGCD